MKNIFLIAPVVAVLLVSGCVHHSPPEKPLTQLQIREMQSREFDTKDTKLIMKSMMNVLQDEGFMIKNAVLDLGLLSAERNIDIENPRDAMRGAIFVGPHARWDKQLIYEASANISEYGNKTRVRMSFQIKKIDNFGSPVDVQTMLDPLHYQAFFEKVGKGLFIQEENI